MKRGNGWRDTKEEMTRKFEEFWDELTPFERGEGVFSESAKLGIKTLGTKTAMRTGFFQGYLVAKLEELAALSRDEVAQ